MTADKPTNVFLTQLDKTVTVIDLLKQVPVEKGGLYKYKDNGTDNQIALAQGSNALLQYKAKKFDELNKLLPKYNKLNKLLIRHYDVKNSDSFSIQEKEKSYSDYVTLRNELP